MKANISSINDYLLCPRKWYYRHILGRGEESRSPALSDGKLWHAVCAGEVEMPLDAPDWMQRAHDELGGWMAKHPDVEILGNEITLESPLSHHFIFGRLDRLVRWNGKLWHWQHKTLAAGVPAAVFTRMQARAFHEHAYKHLVLRHYPDEPYGGTILSMARKFTQNPKKGEPKNPFSVEYLSLPDSGPLLRDMVRVLDDMARYGPPPSSGGSKLTIVSNAIWPPQNPNACGGAFRNSLCEYIDVCDLRRSINEMDEVDPLEGYKNANTA